MKKIVIIVVFVMTFCFSFQVIAFPVPIGEPQIGDSWTQYFQAPAVVAFTMMETFMLTNGVDFEAPGLSNFNDSSWSGALINPNYARATGDPPITPFNYAVSFTSEVTEPIEIDMLLWNIDTLIWQVHAAWGGAEQEEWSFSFYGEGQAPEYDRTPTPEPNTMLLLGFGLIGLAGLKRKSKK